MRLRWLSLALFLLVASPAAGQFVNTPGGTPTDLNACRLGKGSSCYADFTSGGSAGLTASAVERVAVRVICNIANASDNDCTAVAWWCPAGTDAVDTLLCRAMPYQDINGTSQTELNGDASAWREMAVFQAPARLFVVVTTTGQTTRVEVAGR
jgi:hypothetical protein